MKAFTKLFAALLLIAALLTCGSLTASAAEDPITLVEGGNYTIIAGQPVNFYCPDPDNGIHYTYCYWRSTDSAVSFEYDSKTKTAVATGKKAGTYTISAELDNFRDAEKTVSATVTILDHSVPVITQQPKSLGVPSGEEAEVTIEVDCPVSVSCQWYYKYPGETEFKYDYSETYRSYDWTIYDSNSGMQVYCEVTNAYGTTVKSDIATLTRFEITDEPVGGFAGTGKNATTTVTAVGEGLTYRWYAKAPGGKSFKKTDCTSATYSLSMSKKRSGTEAYCVVTDKYGNTLQSRTVYLSRLAITKQPKDTYVPSHNDFTLSVKAEGEGLTYSWHYRDPDSTRFYGASGEASYTETMYDWRSGRTMYCWVTDKYGNKIKSNEVKVSQLGINTQPTGDCAASGKTVSASVSAQGKGLTYQWYVKDPGGKWKKSSTKTNTYSFKMTKSKSGRQAYCVITNSTGHSIKSKTVTFSLLTVKTQPKNATSNIGKTCSTTVRVTGTGLKYRWYVKDPDKESFTRSSVTKATYSFKLTKAKSGRQVYCVITDKYGNSVQTETVTLKRKVTVKITDQPTGVAASSKEKATVTVTAKGDGLKYQWYVKDLGKSKYSKSSVTGNTYSCTMTKARAGRLVYCVVKDQYGNKAKTKTVRLTMINISRQPESVTIDAAGKVSTSIKVSGKGMSYRWYVKDYNEKEFTKSSVTGTSYSCKVTKDAPSRQVYCAITDKYGNTLQSKTVTLSIKRGNSGNDLFDREDCWSCGGDGRCNTCGGRGEVYKWMPGTTNYVYVRCTNCSGGKCRTCYGTGYR